MNNYGFTVSAGITKEEELAKAIMTLPIKCLPYLEDSMILLSEKDFNKLIEKGLLQKKED